MVDPFDEKTMNLEVACQDELGRAVALEQPHDVEAPADEPLPPAGHSCQRVSTRSELGNSDFGDIDIYTE